MGLWGCLVGDEGLPLWALLYSVLAATDSRDWMEFPALKAEVKWILSGSWLIGVGLIGFLVLNVGNGWEWGNGMTIDSDDGSFSHSQHQ